MNRFRKISIAILVIALAGATFSGCIKNDIPYKIIRGNFTKFEVRGQINTIIDTVNRVVTIHLPDTADPRQVYLEDYELTRRNTDILTTTISPALTRGSYLDLSTPMTFTISTFQDYVWTVKVEQQIDIFFEVENQVGATQIDREGKTVLVYVPESTPLNNITVTRAQLGPSNAVITPDPKSITDYSRTQTFSVKYLDITEEWTVRVMQTAVLVVTQTPDAWVKLAYLHAIGQAGETHGFKYKKSGAAAWTTVDPALVISTGGTFSARITGLDPVTEYVYVALSGTNEGEEVKFTTQAAVPLENASFDYWHKVGNIWNPWPAGGTQYWDTGNKGATMVGGDSNSQSSDDLPAGAPAGGKSARLESKYVVLKFAAGNLFYGKYLETEGANGILSFGQPYTSRPTKLKGKFKYTSGIINYASDSNPDLSALMGTQDYCSIYIALSDAPGDGHGGAYEIRTKPSERKSFDPNDPTVIAYGALFQNTSTNGWQDFTIELDYRATNRIPKYIIVVTSASKEGEFFTGSTGSVLYLDQFELVFD